MKSPAVWLAAAILFLAPIVAATPGVPVSDGGLLQAIGAGQPVWTYVLSAIAFAAVLVSMADRTVAGRAPTPLPVALLVWLAGWSVVSAVFRVAVQHPHLAFANALVGGVALAGTYASVAWVCARHARQAPLLLGAATAGAAIMAVVAMQEYAVHLAAHQSTWRVFGTSTPDYLAGYLVMAVPITAGLALAARERLVAALLWMLAALELAAIFTTGSRFALISLVAGTAAFAIGLRLRKSTSAGTGSGKRVAVAAVAVVVALAIVGRPLVGRLLSHGQENSGQFRLWTWRGCLHLLAHNPVLGTGPGTWIYAYPPYALVGYTRIAHSGYLQTADELGVVGLALMLLSLILAARTALRRLQDSSDPDTANTPTLDRHLLLTAVAAAVVAGAVQNVIDSDVFVFALGATLWALVGVASGLARPADAETTATPRRRLALIAGGIGAVAGIAVSIASAAAFVSTLQAQAALHRTDPGAVSDAEAAYQSAINWAPLNGRTLSDLGFLIEWRIHADANAALQTMRSAIELEPTAFNYRRLGDIYAQTGRPADAAAAYRNGLKAEPVSVELLAALASVSSPADALVVYRRMAALEVSPVGTVPAIGDITEPRYAIADVALGDDAAGSGDTAAALAYYRRANSRLVAYLIENGSRNDNRLALQGGRPAPDQDAKYAELFARAAGGLQRLDPTASAPDKRLHVALLKAQFTLVQAESARAIGDTAQSSTALSSAQNQLDAVASQASALGGDVQQEYHSLRKRLDRDQKAAQ